MARAIIREPKVFLSDEPLSNLDAKLRVQMRHEIRRIHHRIHATSVFVTIDQQEGMTLADRLVEMNKGVIEQVGSPEQVYDQPASAYVAGFIGSPAMNFLSGQIDAAAAVLANGDRIGLPAAVAAAQGGKLVQIGLRPGSLSIVAAARGTIAAGFEFAEELGSGRLYHFQFEVLTITVLSPEKLALQPGEKVGIKVDIVAPGALHVFAADTGKRLGAAAAPVTAREPA